QSHRAQNPGKQANPGRLHVRTGGRSMLESASVGRSRDMKLTGNTILITGGSAGIGLALAQKFVGLGNQVIITGRSQERLNAALATHSGLKGIQCDAADGDAVAALGRRLREEHPALNVLINNAGIMNHRNIAKPTEKSRDLTTEVAINLAGPILTVNAFIEQLTANKGTIINVSAGLAFVPLPSAPIYSATKAAIHSYTLSLREQLSNVGVEVIELMPPAVATAMNADLPKDADVKLMSVDELVEATIEGLRAKRREIRPGQANQL